MSASPSFASIGWAAVGVAGPAREIAAGDVDLEAVTGPEGVTNMAEIDGQALDAIRRKMARLVGRVAIHGADHTVHQQHGAPVGVTVDQLGDKIGVEAVRLYGKDTRTSPAIVRSSGCGSPQ